MMGAYLFINLDLSQNYENLLTDVKKLNGVKFANRLYGTYDLVIYMEVKNSEELKSVTLESVRTLKFVKSTVTFISMDSYEK